MSRNVFFLSTDRDGRHSRAVAGAPAAGLRVQEHRLRRQGRRPSDVRSAQSGTSPHGFEHRGPETDSQVRHPRANRVDGRNIQRHGEDHLASREGNGRNDSPQVLPVGDRRVHCVRVSREVPTDQGHRLVDGQV